MRNILCGGMELTLAGGRNSAGDTLENTDGRGCTPRGDQDREKALSGLFQGLHPEEPVGEDGIHLPKLLAGGNGRITVGAKQTGEVNSEGGFTDTIRAGDGPGPIRGLVTEAFGHPVQNLAGVSHPYRKTKV